MESESPPQPTHVTVLLREAVEGLAPAPGKCFVDGTAGGGGHAQLILESAPDIRLLAIDRDPEAVERVARRLEAFGDRAQVVHGGFDRWRDAADAIGWSEVDGVLLDLGFSSFQMDEPSRGFSFMREGPLDMRLDPTQGMTAADLVNQEPVDELKRLFRKYGEEPAAARIARAIVERREQGALQTTADLADVVVHAVPAHRRRAKIHPATLVFQALRIAVNDELGNLERFLDGLPDGLAVGGRVAIISFHSLEDRMVKHRFRALSTGCICPPDLPVCGCGRSPRMREVKRKSIRPEAGEVAENPRARSARLRIAERV